MHTIPPFFLVVPRSFRGVYHRIIPGPLSTSVPVHASVALRTSLHQSFFWRYPLLAPVRKKARLGGVFVLVRASTHFNLYNHTLLWITFSAFAEPVKEEWTGEAEISMFQLFCFLTFSLISFS